MSDIKWQEPFCSGGGNACLQLGFTSDGTPHVRETARPDEIIKATRDGLRHLILATRRGDLARMS